MKRLIPVVGAVVVGLAATVVPMRAQQRPWVFRDFALEGGHYYVRVPDFVEAPKATFLKDEDRVIGVTGEGVAKAYPAAAVTWHHGVEDQIGKLPIFVTW